MTLQNVVPFDESVDAEVDEHPVDARGEGSELVVAGLRRAFVGKDGSVHAVDGVDFHVEPGAFYTLLGPSGCGKSTTLRCVAGLETPTAGQITIHGRVVYNDRPKVNLPAHSRGIGMVFQSYAVWPHMTVFGNVAFPLQSSRTNGKISRAEVRTRVEEALATVGLEGYEDRPATKLSGGQQQRLALARALVARPAVLLLDEPLSNLDTGLRERVRRELKDLQRRSGVTTLYVTHDQAEAFSMSNRIAVMSAGKIVQEGKPREIYSVPATEFVATFVGRTNLLRCQVDLPTHDRAAQTVVAKTGCGAVRANTSACEDLSSARSVVIRPEDVGLSREAAPLDGTATCLDGTVVRSTFVGSSVEVDVAVGSETLASMQHPSVRFRRGESVFVRFPVERTVVVTGSDEVATGEDENEVEVEVTGSPE